MNNQGKIPNELRDASVLLPLYLPLERTEGDGIFDDLVIVGEVSSIWYATEQGGGIMVPASILVAIMCYFVPKGRAYSSPFTLTL